jgi:hypothetical protein
MKNSPYVHKTLYPYTKTARHYKTDYLMPISYSQKMANYESRSLALVALLADILYVTLKIT